MTGLLDRWRRWRAAGNVGIGAARWVVVDCETSGLDVRRDRLLAIGAVALRQARVLLEDSFAAILRQTQVSASANILVHGIGGTAQQEGVEPGEALGSFSAYAGSDPRVAFHAEFDRAMLTRAARAQGIALPDPGWLDLAELMPVLFEKRGKSCRTLDDWLHAFSIAHSARHDALGDAYATAQLFQIALAQASRQGLSSVRDLLRAGRSGKWIGSGAP